MTGAAIFLLGMGCGGLAAIVMALAAIGVAIVVIGREPS